MPGWLDESPPPAAPSFWRWALPRGAKVLAVGAALLGLGALLALSGCGR